MWRMAGTMDTWNGLATRVPKQKQNWDEETETLSYQNKKKAMVHAEHSSRKNRKKWQEIPEEKHRAQLKERQGGYNTIKLPHHVTKLANAHTNPHYP
jgi:DNA primase